MLSQLTIPKHRNSPPALDHQQLYAIGLKHIQQLSNRIWTDYNVHDPGITTLELLCYALTDLSYRASLPIADLLASEQDNARAMQQQFFTARQILPNRALTILDYRKLLIDRKGVKNAWITPSPLIYYADNVTGTLIGSLNLVEADITDLPALVAALKVDTSIATYLVQQFSTSTRQSLSAYVGSESASQPLLSQLIQALNHIIFGNSIYEIRRFTDIALSSETQTLLSQATQDEAQFRLNRLLLEDSLPGLAQSQAARAKTTLPGIIAVPISGLYDVLIEYMDDVTTTSDRQAILRDVRQVLQANRNLCEDFIHLSEVETQEFRLCAELELEPNADVAQVHAELFFQVQQYLAPSVNNYSLSDMLARRKADGSPYSIDEIFAGPLLDCGFIDDAELASAELRQEIRLSDVISIISDISGVRAIRDIVINPSGLSIPLTNKWIVSVPKGKKAVLDRSRSRLVCYKRNMPITATQQQVEERYGQLVQAAIAKAETAVAYDLPVPVGTYRHLDSYYSVQNHFPAVYGLSEVGLSRTTDDHRKALAYQLKAYLLFFDQMMANYVAQLSHVKELFSTDPNLEQTYFQQVVTSFANSSEIYRSEFLTTDLIDLTSLVSKLVTRSDTISEFLWQEFSTALQTQLTTFTDTSAEVEPLKLALVRELNAILNTPSLYTPERFTAITLTDDIQTLLTQTPQDHWLMQLNRRLLESAYPKELARYEVEASTIAIDRRNRFLDHLIARFAERFHDLAYTLSSAFGSSSAELIRYKCDFLNSYPTISRDRSLAYNYSLQADRELWNTDNVSGLEKRLAKLLGIRDLRRRNLGEVSYDIYAEIDQTPNNEFRFRLRHRETLNILLSSSTHYATRDQARQAMEQAIRGALLPDGYDRKVAGDGTHYFNVIDDTGDVLARRIQYFTNPTAMEQAIAQLMAYLQTNYSDEGMYLIENILLRPEQSDDPFLPICPDPNCIDCEAADPYSYRLHIILPAYTSRFRNLEFRQFVETVIREETPAHILPKICWINGNEMAELERLYRDWIYLKAGVERGDRQQKLTDFITHLFAVKNVYPSRQLYECDSDETLPKFLLGQSALGTTTPTVNPDLPPPRPQEPNDEPNS
ncbi:hypothetical protein [Pantanalinema sp. GBBB05]|uniref:hypothetical protein n=1 Tax=Pantanalinema sp. GBBB05 TaxID=2604139 RepID=UPI003D81B22F